MIPTKGIKMSDKVLDRQEVQVQEPGQSEAMDLLQCSPLFTFHQWQVTGKCRGPPCSAIASSSDFSWVLWTIFETHKMLYHFVFSYFEHRRPSHLLVLFWSLLWLVLTSFVIPTGKLPAEPVGLRKHWLTHPNLVPCLKHQFSTLVLNGKKKRSSKDLSETLLP